MLVPGARSYDLPLHLQGSHMAVISNDECRQRMGDMIIYGHICVFDTAKQRGSCGVSTGSSTSFTR